MMVCYSLCMFTSAIQKITISKIKDNASVNYNAVVIELAGGILGVLFIIIYNQDWSPTPLATKCKSVIELTDTQVEQLSHLQHLLDAGYEDN